MWDVIRDGALVLLAGGTFALYSLVSRFARISVSPNQVPEDQEVSSYKLSTPTDSMKRSQKLKEAFQNHLWLRTLIVTVAILGTCMVIGDGVLTPSISGTRRCDTNDLDDASTLKQIGC
ncbi:hypothetical protein Mapa_006367 [Marchantia paleacea]|nr:hypothetical protein Mapa_006367 [Marchantia paleacea]